MSARYFEDLPHTAAYAKFRPVHPVRVAERVISFLKEKYSGPLATCVDAGCGSGQSTGLYSPHFDKVLATDVSPGQIEFAKQGKFPSNVEFLVSPAEVIPLADNSVQVINSAQACHWFNLPVFFKEADRVLCKNGVIALYGYGLPVFVHQDENKAKRLCQLADRFYTKDTAGFWGPEVIELNNEYRNIQIPYVDIVREDIWSDLDSKNLEEFVHYVSTWSGSNNYRKHYGDDAADALLKRFSDEVRTVLETEAEPRDIQLTYKRRYFLVMGRKN